VVRCGYLPRQISFLGAILCLFGGMRGLDAGLGEVTGGYVWFFGVLGGIVVALIVFLPQWHRVTEKRECVFWGNLNSVVWCDSCHEPFLCASVSRCKSVRDYSCKEPVSSLFSL
jgi:hypothetical protein